MPRVILLNKPFGVLSQFTDAGAPGTGHRTQPLRGGVRLIDGMSAPAEVSLIDEPSGLWPRDPPVRVRKSVPDRWIEIAITEGRNRQVRRMTAAVGFPTLRLIRHQVGEWSLDGLASGEWRDAASASLDG